MKRIGLALGGGGARGVAHIAYLEAMAGLGIRPDIIAGTSSGAIVGALYAGGMDPKGMFDVLETLFGTKKHTGAAFKRVKKVPSGVVASMTKKYLSQILPKQRFEDLEIPLKVVTTHFHSLEERVFSSGDILEAVMGSIAYPNTFAPQKIQGEYYIDGGATNVVPFDIIRGECDLLIAIDVSMVRPNNFKPTKENALHATWAATQEALISLKLQRFPIDIFERPDFDFVPTLGFDQYPYVYKRAKEFVPDFIQKLKNMM